MRFTTRGDHQRARSQATIEFALVVGVFIMLLLPTIQLGWIGFQHYSLMRVTRETTRWLAVNWSRTIDANTLAHARGQSFVDANGTTVVNTSGNPLSLKSSHLTLSISPSCTSLVAQPAPDPSTCNQRAQSAAISVTGTYNITAAGDIFFGANVFGIGIPTGNRTYTVTMVME